MRQKLSKIYKTPSVVFGRAYIKKFFRYKGIFKAWFNHELAPSTMVWNKFNFFNYFIRVEEPEKPEILRKDWFLQKHGVRRRSSYELLELYEEMQKQKLLGKEANVDNNASL